MQLPQRCGSLPNERNEMIDRPLSEEEQLVLEYIRQNPGLQADEILDYFCVNGGDDYRQIMSNAIAYLWITREIVRSKTGGLYIDRQGKI
jgi:hypothetical protein